MKRKNREDIHQSSNRQSSSRGLRRHHKKRTRIYHNHNRNRYSSFEAASQAPTITEAISSESTPKDQGNVDATNAVITFTNNNATNNTTTPPTTSACNKIKTGCNNNHKPCNDSVKCLINEDFRGNNLLLLTNGGNAPAGEVVRFNDFVSLKTPASNTIFLNNNSIDIIFPI